MISQNVIGWITTVTTLALGEKAAQVVQESARLQLQKQDRRRRKTKSSIYSLRIQYLSTLLSKYKAAIFSGEETDK
jgi:hypothetical protein